ncbi:hypothetical protein LTR53_007440 [Teratosphaeriaceae sp. CCFEE 6253]|nr:hypothetical protein LTR53_007440 [Teratosphaeriaceae sp. CCFEE 6253]
MAGTKRAASPSAGAPPGKHPKTMSQFSDRPREDSKLTACRPVFSKAQLVDIVVGQPPETSTFAVHEDIICVRSPFIQAALKRCWVKYRIRTVLLEDDDPDIFNLYLQFVYRQPLIGVDVAAQEPGAFDFLTQVYVLADKLGDLTTANQVIDRFVAGCTAYNVAPGPQEVCEAWNATPTNSPLRRLIVDIFTHKVEPSLLAEILEGDDTPRDLLAAIAREFSRRREEFLGRYVADQEETGVLVEDLVHGGKAKDRKMCWYHQHEIHPACDDGDDDGWVTEDK